MLAIPFTLVHSISLTPGLSRAKREAIASLDFGQYVVAHLIVDRAAEDHGASKVKRRHRY